MSNENNQDNPNSNSNSNSNSNQNQDPNQSQNRSQNNNQNHNTNPIPRREYHNHHPSNFERTYNDGYRPRTTYQNHKRSFPPQYIPKPYNNNRRYDHPERYNNNPTLQNRDYSIKRSVRINYPQKNYITRDFNNYNYDDRHFKNLPNNNHLKRSRRRGEPSNFVQRSIINKEQRMERRERFRIGNSNLPTKEQLDEDIQNYMNGEKKDGNNL